MKKFFYFFKWCMDFKLYMAIDALALIFIKGLCVLLMGGDSITIQMLLEMTLVALAASLVQMACFPSGRAFDRPALARRTALWAVGTNLLFIGGAAALGWFAGVPQWVGAALIAMLELGLFFMWLGVHIALKVDTLRLNQSLRDYQNR